MLANEQLLSLHHIDAWQSMLFVYGFGTIGLVGLAAFAFRLSGRYRALGRRAEASFAPNAPLALGETVVQGTVECAEGATEALRIEVEQDGTELENSGVWTHKWTETSRRAVVHPFYLRHVSGARIRVDAGENVKLIDEMNGVIRVDLAKRVRVAELLPGKTVFAVGSLRQAPDPEGARGGSYRDQALGYVLGPPRPGGGPMLLSSEPLGQRFDRRAGFHKGFGILIVLATLVFHLMMAPYHARVLLGRAIDARVTQMHEQGKDDDNNSYLITMQSGDGRTLSAEIPYFHTPAVKVGSVVRLRDVPSWDEADALGPLATARSTAHWGAALLALLAGLYTWRTKATLAWYEREKLVDAGNGKLDASA